MSDSRERPPTALLPFIRRHGMLLIAVVPLLVLFSAFLLFEAAFDDCRTLEALGQRLPSIAEAATFCPDPDGKAATAAEGKTAPSVPALADLSPVIDAGSRVTWLTAVLLVLFVTLPALGFTWWSLWKYAGWPQFRVVALLALAIFAGWLFVWQPAIGEPPRLETGRPSGFPALLLIHQHMTADLLHAVDPAFHGFAYRLYMICFGLLVFSVVSGLFAAGYTLSPLKEAERRNANALAQRMQDVKHFLYLGALLLTVAIIFTAAWLRWPVNLLPPDTALHKDLSALVNSVIMFWGAIYSAILLSAYLPGALCLRARARGLAARSLGQAGDSEPGASKGSPDEAEGTREPPSEKEIEKYLKDNRLLLPLADQLQRVLAIFAPAMAGPLISAIGALNQIPG